MGRSQTNHRLKSPNSHGDGELLGFASGRIKTKVAVETCGIADCVLIQLWGLPRFHKGDVLLEEFTSDKLAALLGSRGQIFLEDSSALSILLVLYVQLFFNHSLIIEIVDRRCIISIHEAMIGNDSLSDTPILLWIFLVKHDEEKIETREEGIR